MASAMNPTRRRVWLIGATAAVPTGALLYEGSGRAVPGSYLVVLKGVAPLL
jgi:hypothetical protein